MQFGGDVLQRTSAQHDLFGSKLDLCCDRRKRNARHQRAQCRQYPHRLGRIVLAVFGKKFVGIELARRQRRAQQRRRPEAQLAIAREFQRTLFRTKNHFERVKPRGGGIGLDLGRDAPGRRRFNSAILAPKRARQRHRAFEARRARLEREHAVEIDRQRPRTGIDIDVNPRAVAVRSLAGGDPERIARTRQREIAVAADRTRRQRAHITRKRRYRSARACRGCRRHAARSVR